MSETEFQDISKESIGKLINRLAPGQLWKVLGALIVLLSGSFSFGYWISSNISQTQISQINLDLNTIKVKNSEIEKKLKDREHRIELLHIKELLLGKIVLYRHWEEQVMLQVRSDAEQKKQEIGKDLRNFVENLRDRTTEGDAKQVAEVHISKGITPSVTFEFDETTVPLPGELFGTLE